MHKIDPMHKIVIVADDLSGAADCGVKCVHHGLSTLVTLGDTAPVTATDVIAFDADTRNLNASQAAGRTASIVQQATRHDGQLLFKKLDSTLRGNAAAELAATLRVRRAATAHRVAAVLAPAFPANGRTTVHGHQLLHGKHLHLTELGQREKMSSRCDLAAVMQAAGLSTSVVALSLIRSSQLDLSSALHELATRADVLICDAETDSDLHSIAASAITLGPSTIWAGSAGLAYHLPLAAGLSRPIQLTHLPPPPALPIMLAIGSTSVVTREQVSYLLASSPITAITIAPAALLDGPSSPTWQHAQANVTAALAAQEDTAILIGDETIVPKDVASRLALAMGQFLAPHHAGVGALVATGGETARAVMQAWGISALRLLAEVEPGLPLSVTEGWHRPLPVITKAGAFGQPSALVHCLRTLKKPSSLHPGTPL